MILPNKKADRLTAIFVIFVALVGIGVLVFIRKGTLKKVESLNDQNKTVQTIPLEEIGNAEIKAFVSYFFVPGSTPVLRETELFELRDQAAQDLLSSDDICSANRPCNNTKEYFLEFTPNFIFETTHDETTIAEADPDSFVDLCDIKKKKYYRVIGTGTEGSIYGTYWLSDYSFIVYGMESNDGFIDIFDIKAKTRKSYVIDSAKRKTNADPAAFLMTKNGP